MQANFLAIGTVQCSAACGTLQVSNQGLPAGEYLIPAIFCIQLAVLEKLTADEPVAIVKAQRE